MSWTNCKQIGQLLKNGALSKAQTLYHLLKNPLKKCIKMWTKFGARFTCTERAYPGDGQLHWLLTTADTSHYQLFRRSELLVTIYSMIHNSLLCSSRQRRIKRWQHDVLLGTLHVHFVRDIKTNGTKLSASCTVNIRTVLIPWHFWQQYKTRDSPARKRFSMNLKLCNDWICRLQINGNIFFPYFSNAPTQPRLSQRPRHPPPLPPKIRINLKQSWQFIT